MPVTDSYMENMRLPVPHFHLVVAAALMLGAFGAQAVHAQAKLLRAEGADMVLVQDESEPGESPAQPPDDMQSPDDPDADQAASDALAEPASPSEPSVEARLRDREDLNLLFTELAEPDGESWSRAETDILRIWSRSGSSAMDLLYKRGEAALDAGDATGAIGHLTALTDHAPDFAMGWYLRSVAFYMDGETGPAIADLKQTLILEPRHFAALTQLGAILEELGDNAHALEAYRASLRIHPHQQDALDAIARLEQESQGTDA